MTDNQSIRQAVSSFIYKPATCLYKDKARAGHIVSVKQGPAIKEENGEWKYCNNSYGDVYVDWMIWTFESGYGEIKCFKWNRVEDFRLVDKPAAQAEAPVKKEDTRGRLEMPIFVSRARPRMKL